MWHGYRYTDFEFEGRQATLVFPEKPDEKMNWALKTEYQYAFIEEELALLGKGFHVAFLRNNSRFASKADCDAKARFCEFLHNEYGLREKCVPIGMSLGGAHAVNFAGFYPEKWPACISTRPYSPSSSMPRKCTAIYGRRKSNPPTPASPVPICMPSITTPWRRYPPCRQTAYPCCLSTATRT